MEKHLKAQLSKEDYNASFRLVIRLRAPYAKPLSYEATMHVLLRMRGTSYTHGFAVRGTLRNDEGIYFNLGGKYASLTFKTGMKDGKYTARKPAKVTIKADGKNIENGIFEIKDDEAFSIHTINVKRM